MLREVELQRPHIAGVRSRIESAQNKLEHRFAGERPHVFRLLLRDLNDDFGNVVCEVLWIENKSAVPKYLRASAFASRKVTRSFRGRRMDCRAKEGTGRKSARIVRCRRRSSAVEIAGSQVCLGDRTERRVLLCGCLLQRRVPRSPGRTKPGFLAHLPARPTARSGMV